MHEWRNANREKHRATCRARNDKNRKTVINHYGGSVPVAEKPLMSSYQSTTFITWNEERKQYKSQMWKSIIKRGFPEGFQILCYNCNNARAYYGNLPTSKGDKNDLLTAGVPCQPASLPGSKKEQEMIAGSGLRLLKLYSTLDQHGASLKC